MKRSFSLPSHNRTFVVCATLAGLGVMSAHSQEGRDELLLPSPIELPPAVAAASVMAEITVPTGSSGSRLIIRRIEAPALAESHDNLRVVTADPADVQAETEPEQVLEEKLFLPAVEVFSENLSRIRWHVLDTKGTSQHYMAWVALDLSSVEACGEFQTGQTIYNVLAATYAASTDEVESAPVPAPGELENGFRLIAGDPSDKKALEPVLALIRLYAQEGNKIVTDYVEMKARQAAREKWRIEHPEPPASAEIRLWPVQSTQYPTQAR